MRGASDNLSKAHTAATIAAESGVDERTVRRAGKLAEAVGGIEKTEPYVAAMGREALIERAKETLKPHVANNSGDNEWYTPKPYIEAATAVMGCIDLDPASSEKANAVVGAKAVFTKETDGLKRDWAGRVFLNPPYASELVGKFIEKLAASVESGSVTEALVLVNNATETKWFARLASVSTCLCFPNSRVRFWKPDSDKAAPLQGQAVAYIGKHASRFHKHFRAFGILCDIRHE
jgi:phage N-6-adenine-methyltransferase